MTLSVRFSVFFIYNRIILHLWTLVSAIFNIIKKCLNAWCFLKGNVSSGLQQSLRVLLQNPRDLLCLVGHSGCGQCRGIFTGSASFHHQQQIRLYLQFTSIPFVSLLQFASLCVMLVVMLTMLVLGAFLKPLPKVRAHSKWQVLLGNRVFLLSAVFSSSPCSELWLQLTSRTPSSSSQIHTTYGRRAGWTV